MRGNELLNRYTLSRRIVGSNSIPSAKEILFSGDDEAAARCCNCINTVRDDNRQLNKARHKKGSQPVIASAAKQSIFCPWRKRWIASLSPQ